jgi:aminocarboxymuconate-semialdehyde decarboxylase
MEVIDCHTHILPPELPIFKKKFGYGGFITLEHQTECCARMVRDDGQFFREVGKNCWDPLERIQECEQTGVSKQVLSTVPVMFNYWAKPKDTLHTAQYLNDHIAEVVAKAPNNFYGLGTLPMQSPELALQELERCIKQLGLCGVQIGSHVNGWNLCAEELFPIFKACEALGAAVFVHPWEMIGLKEMPKYWLPWLVGMPAETTRAICSMIFGGIFERCPNLRVCFAHGGGTFAFTLGRIAHGFTMRPDLCAQDNQICPSEYLGKFYVDSLVHDDAALRFLIDKVGIDKVMLGSDYPFPLGELEPGKLINESLMEHEDRHKLLHGNAKSWLGV